MKCWPGKDRGMAGGIRLLDVAAILCVLAVLAFLGIVGMSRFKEHTLRAGCQSNLKQLATALSLYTKDNRGLLPDCTPANPRYVGPVWPWDINTNLASNLEALGMTRAAFYCPANPGMNDDRHWNFWRANGGSTRVTGYPTLFEGIQQVPPNLWRTKLSNPGREGAAGTELSFDATAALNGNYTRIQGTYIDRSNHVRDKRPLGGNILFLDQHVQWRDFADMKVRFETFGVAGPIMWSY